MKVFISWSGERSKLIGSKLHAWLPMVLQSVDPWLSESDIDAGDRWGNEVGKELQDSNFGIICITRENMSSPWILFEAGALVKFMQEGRVVPLLYDVEFKDITGPLAQFQAKKIDKAGIFDIVSSINENSDSKLADARLEGVFQALWAKFEEDISTIPVSHALVKKARDQHDILEEMVSSIRSIEQKFHDNQSVRVSSSISRKSGYTREKFIYGDFSPVDPIHIIILASQIKDEFPWLFELAKLAYIEQTTGSGKSKPSLVRLFSSVKMLSRGPAVETLEISTAMILKDMWSLLLAMDAAREAELSPYKLK